MRTEKAHGCGEFVDCLETVLQRRGCAWQDRRGVFPFPLPLPLPQPEGGSGSRGELVAENSDPCRELVPCGRLREIVGGHWCTGRTDREYGEPLRSHLRA